MEKLQRFGEANGIWRRRQQRKPTLQTIDGMGLVVPEKPRLSRSELQKALQKHKAKSLVLATSALSQDRPGECLQLAKAVWAAQGLERNHGEAAEICARAYEALERPVLAHICRVHAAHRNIRDIDLLR
jgi:hypothetical protein